MFLLTTNRRTAHSFLCVGLAVLTLFSGCRVGPDYCPPTVPAPLEWHQPLDNAVHANECDLACWWKLLNDPVLDALIECSVDGNLNAYSALTRVWQARTQVCITESAKKGMVSGIASHSRVLQSQNAFGFFGGGGGGAGGGGIPATFSDVIKTTTIGAMTSWEPDIWGRVFRQVESAEAQLCGTVEMYRDALVVLYGDIAKTYVEIRTLQARLEYAKRNVQIQDRTLKLVQRRVVGGISPVLEEYQAESNLASTESEIPQLESQLHQALNRLAVLAGEYPGTLHDCLAQPFPIPEPPEQMPISLPCDVIRQRPDIRLAERTLAARTAEVGVAIAELYPKLSLGGTFTLSSNEVSSLIDGDSIGYNFGPSISWPVLNGGRIRCEIKASKYAVEEAIAEYQSAVLNGAEEVENAIVAYRTELNRLAALQRTVRAAEKSLDSVLELYRNDKENFQNVLDSLRTLFTAQNSLAVAEGQVIQNLITLYRAFGGGWHQDDHCADRKVRLRCPQRAHASIVDVEPIGDAAQQYFEGQPAEFREGAKSPQELNLPEVDRSDLDVKKSRPFDVDAFFQKVLDRSRTEDDESPADTGDAASDGGRSLDEPATPDDGEEPASRLPDLDRTLDPEATDSIQSLPRASEENPFDNEGRQQPLGDEKDEKIRRLLRETLEDTASRAPTTLQSKPTD